MRPLLDEYFLAMLPLVASRGTCPRRQVACILTDQDGRLVSTGYNGSAPGMGHCTEDDACAGHPAFGGTREQCLATHAELNAVLQSLGSRRQPFTAYCSLTPCKACAQALLGCGVKQVVALALYQHGTDGPRLLNKAGVTVWVWQNNERAPWAAHVSEED